MTFGLLFVGARPNRLTSGRVKELNKEFSESVCGKSTQSLIIEVKRND